MLPLGLLNFVAVALVSEAQHLGWFPERFSLPIICLAGWLVLLVSWIIVATGRPRIADNHPRTQLGRYEIDSQI